VKVVVSEGVDGNGETSNRARPGEEEE